MALPMDEVGGGDVAPEGLAILVIDVAEVIAPIMEDGPVGIERLAIVAAGAGEVKNGHGIGVRHGSVLSAILVTTRHEVLA